MHHVLLPLVTKFVTKSKESYCNSSLLFWQHDLLLDVTKYGTRIGKSFSLNNLFQWTTEIETIVDNFFV